MDIPTTSDVRPAEPPYRVPPAGLTAQQQEFVRLYLLRGSAYSAYLQAFSVTEPCDLANARTYAYRLLKAAEVKTVVKAATAASRKRLRLSADAMLREAGAIATASAGDYNEFDAAGVPKLKPAREIDAVAQRAIKSIEQTERRVVRRHPDGTVTEETTVTTRLALHDKVRALQPLFRHFGLDRAVNPLEALLDALPLDLQHRVGEVLRVSFRLPERAPPPLGPSSPDSHLPNPTR